MNAPLINLVLPVYNEERILAQSVQKLMSFLPANLPYPFELVIAENGSSDRTFEIARELQVQDPAIQILQLAEKGRGRALAEAWRRSGAGILSYMDADLSTDLGAFPSLIEPLVTGCYDMAIGSRLLKHELTSRSLKRELLSRGYNSLLRKLLRIRCSDAQCGFKAITRGAATVLLPLVKSTNWFFDTELLAIAEKLGYRIFETPVSWIENRESHVRLLSTITEDLWGILKLKHRLRRRSCRNQGWR